MESVVVLQRLIPDVLSCHVDTPKLLISLSNVSKRWGEGIDCVYYQLLLTSTLQLQKR